MAPPATFIAVQCCQCSTMQVKQQKKSTNKWTCVVCNQKQSVRKIYAQGFMAKDVRNFVQSFNMSRQLADQNQLQFESNQVETLEDIGYSYPTNIKQRRSDWTEYLDHPEEDSSSGIINKFPVVEDGEFDLKVVIEMPKPVFKKPKLRNYSVSSTGRKDYAPTFNKRNKQGKSSRRVEAVVLSSSKCSTAMVKENSREMHYAPGSQMEDIFVNKMEVRVGITKWKGGLIRKDDEIFAKEVTWGSKSARPGASSKWSSYISDDNEGILLGTGRDFTAQGSEWKDDAIRTQLIDQRVEEDIHPDFL